MLASTFSIAALTVLFELSKHSHLNFVFHLQTFNSGLHCHFRFMNFQFTFECCLQTSTFILRLCFRFVNFRFTFEFYHQTLSFILKPLPLIGTAVELRTELPPKNHRQHEVMKRSDKMTDNDGDIDDKRGTRKVNQAIGLLHEVISFLGSEKDKEESGHVVPAFGVDANPRGNIPRPMARLSGSRLASQTTSSTTGPTSVLPSTPTIDRGAQIRQSFAGLFGPYQRASQLSTSSSVFGKSARSWAAAGPPSKKSKIHAKETWTHEFFCLSKATALNAPSRQEKAILQNAGLGRKKIKFNKNGSALHVKQMLEAAYPKIVQGGGFEILRSGISLTDQLQLITAPSSGYSVSFLRDMSGLGQALAYLRPVQRNLDTSQQAEVASSVGGKVLEGFFLITNYGKMRGKL